MVNTAGTFLAPHFDYGFTSGFLMLVSSSKIFITFAVFDANRKKICEWHMKDLKWEDALFLMRNLEGPQINYVTLGQSIYVATGQPHMVLSPRASGLVTFDIANPSIVEWVNTLKGYNQVLDGFCKYLANKLAIQLGLGIKELKQGLRLWENVKGLPAQQDEKTVAQSEVNAFVRKQKTELGKMILMHKKMTSKALLEGATLAGHWQL